MSSPRPNTILIIDDDKAVIDQLARHFRRRGYEPIATADPTTVENTLANFEVHLILLDLRMERLNGYEVLKKLRDRSVKTPVLIITAYFQDERERLKNAGIFEADVIQKPFRDFAKIEATIDKKLGGAPRAGGGRADYDDEIYYDNVTKVLVVDDEPEITDLLADVLRERRYDVKVFNRGDHALAYLKANTDGCHIAIVDMAMPGLKGHELMRDALKVDPKIKFIPITARYEEEVRHELQSVGVRPETLLTKPFRLPELIQRIKELAIGSGTLGARS